MSHDHPVTVMPGRALRRRLEEPETTEATHARSVLLSATGTDWVGRGLLLAILLVQGLAWRLAMPLFEAAPPINPLSETNSSPAQDTPVDASLSPVDVTWSASPELSAAGLRFRVFVTSSDLAFDFGHVDRLTLGGRPADLEKAILTPVFLSSMRSCRTLVVVGAASQEGEDAAELQRARQRADHVQYAMFSSGLVRCPLYTLTVGRARPSVARAAADPSATAFQRRLIVLAVLEAPAQTLREPRQLRDALHRVVSRLQGLPVDLVRDYASFELESKH